MQILRKKIILLHRKKFERKMSKISWPEFIIVWLAVCVIIDIVFLYLNRTNGNSSISVAEERKAKIKQLNTPYRDDVAYETPLRRVSMRKVEALVPMEETLLNESSVECEEEDQEEYKDKLLLTPGNTIKGDVEFKNVKFGYTADKIIIPDFSASIKAGMKVAIVGPTGAGKTTLVNLLMRFYELDGGDITIDGKSIRDMSKSEVRSIFSMVLQDSWIFDGTIKENIVYSKKNVSDEELNNALEEASLSHYVKTLENGVDTRLNGDSSLSQGQKQLLTIARAFVENAPLLILDEATSNVDTRTELQIQEAMDKLTKGRTSFVIAHRLSTIKNADLILVLKDGNIIEQGNHDELMSLNGFYSELYNSQFDEANE